MEGLVKILIVIFVIFVIVSIISGISNIITIDKAMARFQEITGTKDIEIIRYSNTALIFGNPYDVTFELKVDGKLVSARCTSGTFSQMVCRIYNEGD
jgi:hypothetical protein